MANGGGQGGIVRVASLRPKKRVLMMITVASYGN
jgi:hypothetical protein